MNRFLRDLINRHRHPSDQMEASVIEPRPKSRFESDAISALESRGSEGNRFSSTPVTKELPETVIGVQKENRKYESSQVEVKQSFLPPESHEKNPADSLKGRLNFNKIDSLNARIEAISLQLGNKLSVTEPNADGQKYSQLHKSKISSRITNNETQADSHDLSKTYALNHQVESVIKRLANQTAERSNEQSRNTKQTSIFVRELIPDFKQQGQPIQVESDVDEPTSISGILDNESQAEQHKVPPVPHAGLLQPPGWLTEMQSELNQRWQDINAQLKPSDPVVNVTIGRVEVRAVKAETTKQPNQKNKPNGVMSLDDYLKERA